MLPYERLTHMNAADFWVAQPVEGCRKEGLHLEGSAGVSSSSPKVGEATLKDFMKMKRAIVWHVISVRII